MTKLLYFLHGLLMKNTRGNSQICHGGVIHLMLGPFFARPKGFDAIIDATDALPEAPVNHHEVVDDSVVAAAVDGALRASGFSPEGAKMVEEVKTVFVDAVGFVVSVFGVVVPQHHVANAALFAGRHRRHCRCGDVFAFHWDGLLLL